MYAYYQNTTQFKTFVYTIKIRHRHHIGLHYHHVSNSQGQQIQKASKDGHDYLEKLKPLAKIIVPQTLIF